MGLIYHAALENSLIMCFISFIILNTTSGIYSSKIKSTIFFKSTNRDNPSWNSSSKLSKNVNIMFNKVSE